MGAWRSRRIGWDRKICLALMQSWRISDSESWTCFPPFPSNNLLITSSITALSIIPSIVVIIIVVLVVVMASSSSSSFCCNYCYGLINEAEFYEKEKINKEKKVVEMGKYG